MEQRKFDFIKVTLEPEDYDKVKEVYRLHKEQASKLFDLSSNIVTDEDVMDYIKVRITYDIVLLAIDKETNHYSGCVILQDPIIYDDRIVNMECHLVVGKRYWGKNSRQIIFDCYKYLNDNMKPIDRLECCVPSNNYGIIKLLKDVGFKVEGTLRNKLIFRDKNNKQRHYNELIYSNINLGE